MLGVEGFTTAVKAGTDVRRADYQNFLENAGAAAKQEVASRLGLAANLDAVPFEEFLSAARRYAATGEGRATFEKARLLRQQQSSEAVAASEGAATRVSESVEEKRAIRSEFSTELQKWFDSTTSDERAISGKRFLVGTTSRVLQSIGVKKCNIFFGGSKINKILKNNASMDLDIVKQAVMLLEDPILVMKSLTVENSIVAFGEVYTNDGKPVMVSLLIDPKNKNGEILDYAVITSAYGRRKNNLQNLIDKSLMYYVNPKKERTDTWLKALGLQLPSAITTYGSINIIPDSSEKSNSSAEENFSNRRDALPEDGGAASREGETTDARATTDTDAKAIDSWALDNVKGYDELLPNERTGIRALVRQGRALGISDADIAAYASVSSRSGVKISFSKERVATGKDGKLTHSDGFYDPATGEIVINPEGKRSTGKLLLHELSHALYGNKRFAKALDSAVRNMNADRAEKILDDYRKAGRTTASELLEELAVHHAEDVLGNRENLARLLRDEPTIGDKILSFFGLARDAYTGRLSREAGRLYRHFETALKELSAENRGNLASDTLTFTNGEKTHVSGEGRRDAVDTDVEERYNKDNENQGGRDGEKENRNTGVLERRSVPTVDGSDDYIWKQSKNTKALKGILGYDDAYVRENNIRAGESGWLANYHGANGHRIPDEVQSARRFLQSVRGNLSRTPLKQTDTVGRIVPEDVIHSFGDTVFKTEDGTILSLWHWTDKKFEKFKYGDIGFHAGIFDAAHAIMFDKQAQGEKGYFKELYVKSTNPLFVDRDMKFWTPAMVSYYCDIFDENQISILSQLRGFGATKYDSPASQRLREILKQKGYDSIVYPNDWEGGLSVIAFDNEQFYTVAENGLATEKQENSSGRRDALPEEEFTSSTLESVGKEKRRYEPKLGDRIFTAKTRAYIEAVDELHGIEVYLRKAGGRKRADAEARVQVARTARSQAQTMIGSLQYDVFSDNPKELGDGLLEILKPTRNWSERKHLELNDYLLHRLNIDRMTVEGRAKVLVYSSGKRVSTSF